MPHLGRVVKKTPEGKADNRLRTTATEPITPAGNAGTSPFASGWFGRMTRKTPPFSKGVIWHDGVINGLSFPLIRAYQLMFSHYLFN